MFGSTDQNSQQQDPAASGFGAPLPANNPVLDSSQQVNVSTNNNFDTPDAGNGGGLVQDISAPIPAPDPGFSSAPIPEPAVDSVPASIGGGDDLLSIKQSALQHLSPLVDHIDQTPEEKFRTTMMMIQASDDQKLVKVAFEAAQNIADDKARAQALLDIINEINYFTQQHNS